MSDHYDRAFALAHELGLDVESFIADGEWHRVSVAAKKRKNEDGAYCVSELVLRDGRIVVVGMLSNHKMRLEQALTLEGVCDVSPEDLAEARARAAEATRKGRKEKAKKRKEAAVRAEEIFSKLPDSGVSEYLRRKQVKGWGVRFSRGSIVVPVRDARGALSTLQFINADGDKKFLTGGAKRGRFHLIGTVAPEGGGHIIGVSEGYATGASVHEVLGIPVGVAFDAGNLTPVCEALLGVYPQSKIIVFADLDIFGGYSQAFIRKRDASAAVLRLIERLGVWRPDVLIEVVEDNDPRMRDRERSYNIGVTEAVLAAAAVGGDVVIPQFKGGV